MSGHPPLPDTLKPTVEMPLYRSIFAISKGDVLLYTVYMGENVVRQFSLPTQFSVYHVILQSRV